MPRYNNENSHDDESSATIIITDNGSDRLRVGIGGHDSPLVDEANVIVWADPEFNDQNGSYLFGAEQR